MENEFNQEAYDMHVNKGMLPIIDIVGHTFYVDIRMDMLRPKDDFFLKVLCSRIYKATMMKIKEPTPFPTIRRHTNFRNRITGISKSYPKI